MQTIEKLNKRNHSRMVDNILEVYSLATPENIKEGISWYWEANRLAKALTCTGHPLKVTSSVIAVISPQLKWERNVKAAENLLLTGEKGSIPVLGPNVAKAKRILLGENPEDVVRGNKVYAFWKLIQNPRKDNVVIDSHAFNIATGMLRNDKQTKHLERVGVYELVATAYRAAAEEKEIKPHAMQAVTWCYWINNYRFAKSNDLTKIQQARKILV